MALSALCFWPFEMSDQCRGCLSTGREVTRSGCRRSVNKCSRDAGRRDRGKKKTLTFYQDQRKEHSHSKTQPSHTHTHFKQTHTLSSFLLSHFIIKGTASLRWQSGSCYLDNEELDKSAHLRLHVPRFGNKRNPKKHTRHYTQFRHSSSILPSKKQHSSFLSKHSCDLRSLRNLRNWAMIIDGEVCEGIWAGDEVGKGRNMGPFYYAPFCSSGNKATVFFLFLFCCCSSTLGVHKVTSIQESLLIHLKGFSVPLLK